MRYRKKPVVIEAFRLGYDCMPDWFVDAITENRVILRGTSSGFYHANDTSADIETLEGMMHASYGDYIIRGVKGEIYPCKPDIFLTTYEEADGEKAVSDSACTGCRHNGAEIPNECWDCVAGCNYRASDTKADEA